MKTLKILTLAVVILLTCALLYAAPTLHKFELWGKGTETDRLNLYFGWTNGFFYGRGIRGMELQSCLESMTYKQALAMIDKRYKDHPELWSRSLGGQILEALTAKGGPCEGKNPLASAR